MAARLGFAVFVVTVLGACSAAAPTVTPAPAATSTPAAPSTPSATVAPPVTTTPAQSSPTAAAATATPNAPATSNATAAPSAAVATATAATAGCSVVLTEADIDRGFPLTETIPYQPNPAPTGFEAATRVKFDSGLETGDDVVSTVECFDSPENARAQFDQWGVLEGWCIDANRTPVDAEALDFGPILGADDSKGTLCKADQAGSFSVGGQASVYVLRGPVVFTVTFNRNDLQSAPTDVITTLALAAPR